MGDVKGLKGLRHIALKVKDIKRSKAFYQETFGMRVVWEPDSQNVYLSSGSDNLALHEISTDMEPFSTNQLLDHFGFIVDEAETVKELEKRFQANGVRIIHPFKIHRDGSASFYCADPDGIVIQMLYEPHLSPQETR